MCRMLIVDDVQQTMLSEKAQMYVHLLSLPVELQCVTGIAGARRSLESGKHIDILMAASGSTNRAQSDVLYAAQPWVKRMYVKCGEVEAEPESNALLLDQEMDLDSFYRAISLLAPETAKKADNCKKSRRWYGSNPVLQERIMEVLRIIKEEYRDDINLDYLAQRVYTSPCYLSTLFRKFIGVGPLAYLNNYRMRRAIDLLLETDASVTEICQQVGYRSLPYFCTCFKSKYHTTPAQYREQSRCTIPIGA